MKSAVGPGVVLVLVTAYACTAEAQSLGDVARQEEHRRKSVKASGKVYTNDSLRSEAAPPPPAQPSAAPAGQPAPAQGGLASPTAAQQPPVASPPTGTPVADMPKDEAGWRKRITDARDALSRAQIFAEALQSRINALSTDFVNRDDPAQRSVIGAERDKALAELARLQQEIQQHQKAIAAIQDDARRAAVPAGWVR